LRNQRGSAIIVALMVLLLLTLTGILSLKRSMRESHGAAMNLVSEMNFYTAESGLTAAAINTKQLVLDGYFTEPEEPWTGDIGGSHYSVDIHILSGYDPITGANDFIARSTGTHQRGRTRIVEAQYKFVSVFIKPRSPLWVYNGVDIKGSVNIYTDVGEPEVEFDISTVEIPNKYCDDGECNEVLAAQPFPMGYVETVLRSMYTGGDPTTLIENSSEDNPAIVIADGGLDYPNGAEGWGILFVNGGNFKMNAGDTWHGIIITSGVNLVKLNGNADIYGSLIIGDNDTSVDPDLTGNLDLYYDADIINKLFNKFSNYKMVWWREIMPKITVLPSGAIIRR